MGGDASGPVAGFPQVDDDRGDHLGGAAAGADQLGAVVVAVLARRHLEKHVAVADDAAEFAFLHGFSFAGRANYPNVIPTLSRISDDIGYC
jgi:hypothetical protein